MAAVKIIELIGTSSTSSDDAVQQALTEARTSLRNIKAVDVGLHGPPRREPRRVARPRADRLSRRARRRVDNGRPATSPDGFRPVVYASLSFCEAPRRALSASSAALKPPRL